MTEKKLYDKMLKWAKSEWIPETKEEEDKFFMECSKMIESNCKSNPGSIGEYLVEKIIKDEFKLNVKKDKKDRYIECNWLEQKYILPDCITDNYVFEVKTLRYYNSNGKLGNQGTGSEKLFSCLNKYSNFYKEYGKRVFVIFVADQQNEKNGKQLLEMMNKKFNNNIFIKHNYKLCKKSKLIFTNIDDFIKIHKKKIIKRFNKNNIEDEINSLTDSLKLNCVV